MQFTKTLSSAAVALGFTAGGFALPALAQDAPLAPEAQAPVEAPLAPEAQAGTAYTNEALTAFVQAALAVNEVDQRYQAQVMEAQDPAVQQELIESANAEMIQAVEETPGITLEEYMEIGQAAEADPELNARLIAMVQEVQGGAATQIE
ncbi:DUF4168 domain-containing protein [Halodurantibacterium flavum]|uniref:DUF4168 domain-containing protein n=1 Tax=Halodurantibacterium flavum TaxID=1382802 RepID=A0ABW4S9Z5_9RHOB